ncbi:MAG: L-methionine/branched-chain amino acid transporter [Thiothrix sp.]|nr:L-methionine/branched-chain amino acid transporter [Thiothrix sp.]HPQ95727.1 L-methionine/branched-chain amino acid transporter [Thiolinea sp.]
MTRLNQTITRWQGMGLMATTLLGTGVFILPQHTLASAGDMTVWTWGLLIMAVLPLALVFAELGRRFPSAAGPAFFVRQAFGYRYGRVVGLMFLLVVPLGAPAALIMTFEFLKPLITLSPGQQLLGQVLVIAALYWLNWRGLQLSGQSQLILTLVIVVVVGAMLLAFLWQVPVLPPLPAGSGSGMLGAIGLAIWSFLGIEAITHLSAEFRDAQRDFIPAVLGGTVLVGLVYLACTWLSMLAPDSGLAMVSAYEQLLGNSGRWVIAILGIGSGIATVNVYMASAARLAWSLSQDGVLPARLQYLNRHQVPVVALLLVLGLAMLVMVLAHLAGQDFMVMVRWTNGVFVLIYTLSMLAAWRLVRRRFRPAIGVALLVCGLFAWSLGADMAYACALMLMLGLWQASVRRAPLPD